MIVVVVLIVIFLRQLENVTVCIVTLITDCKGNKQLIQISTQTN